ncbi:MAG: S41 family peptidase [Anaerolineales bacterium]|nr:S41 family peptidase [Anaerolineales bacterium]
MSLRKTASYLVLIVGWFLIGFFVRGLNIVPVNWMDAEMALVREAEQVIAVQSYNSPASIRQLTYGAIRGLLASIDDDYAEFLDPQTAERVSLESEGRDAVIGLSGEMRDGQFVVTDVFSDLPAQQAGVLEGDILLEIDDWKIARNSTRLAVIAMIRGPINSTAHLVVQRNDQILNIDVPRIPAVDINTKVLESNIAYLRLDRFTTQTGSQMEEAVKSLMSGNPKAIIWDLRFNGGGSMDATRQTLDLFLDDGMAFYAQVRDGTLIPYPTVSGGIAEDIPLVVLIGPNTYSAPETAVAAIKDRGRGILIGESTYGKDSIITSISLSDGSSIRFTVAKWLTPVTQQAYEGEGVPADIIVPGDPTPDEDLALQAAIRYINDLLP